MSKNEERMLKIEKAMRKVEAENNWEKYDHEIYDHWKIAAYMAEYHKANKVED